MSVVRFGLLVLVLVLVVVLIVVLVAILVGVLVVVLRVSAAVGDDVRDVAVAVVNCLVARRCCEGTSCNKRKVKLVFNSNKVVMSILIETFVNNANLLKKRRFVKVILTA